MALVIGCSSHSEPTPSPTNPATASPSRTPTIQPTNTPTASATPAPTPGPFDVMGVGNDYLSGDANVDAVIGELRQADTQALAARVTYELVPCAGPGTGFPSPPSCPPGESDGTIVSAFLVLGNEGRYIKREDLSAFLGEVLSVSRDLCVPETIDGGMVLRLRAGTVGADGFVLLNSLSVVVADERITGISLLSEIVAPELAVCTMPSVRR
jgi:hypothetical protein